MQHKTTLYFKTLVYPVIVSLFVANHSISFGQCPTGEIQDCNGNCYPASWVGDGVCDNGWIGPVDFMCVAFNWDGGDCIGPGCTDSLANNYNPTATIDDGSCVYGYIQDCSGHWFDSTLLQSYLHNWHCNNGFWSGGGWDIGGNINLNCAAFNFDNGECAVSGCTDSTASNYYEHANTNDGSCQYGTCPPGKEDCMGHCIPDNWIGVNGCPGGLSSNPLPHLYHGAYPDSLYFNIPVDADPKDICVLPDGSKAYVATASTVTVVDLQGLDNGSWTTQSVFVGGLAYTCTPSSDGLHVFIANWGLGTVQVLEVATNSIVYNIPAGPDPLKIHSSHDGQRLFVSNHGGNSVTVIDAITWQVIITIAVGDNPRNICTSINDSLLYTANWGSSSVSVVDLVTYQVIDTVEVDYWPQAIWPTPDGKYILVANFGFDFSFDHISVIRSKDNLVIARLQTGAGPEDMVTLGEVGQYLYVSNWGMPCCFYTASNLCCSSEVNKGTMTVIALPDFEFWVAPDSVPLVIPYITSTLTTIPLQGEYSFGMDRHPNGRFVFAVNMESNSMSVIGLSNGVIASTTPTSGVKEELNLWPNPANEQFHVSCTSDIERLRLLDLYGREVRCWRNVDKSLAFRLDGIGSGYYLAEITTPLGIAVEKLVLLGSKK